VGSGSRVSPLYSELYPGRKWTLDEDESCWHCCRWCRLEGRSGDWRHTINPDDPHLDEYFAPCARCTKKYAEQIASENMRRGLHKRGSEERRQESPELGSSQSGPSGSEDLLEEDLSTHVGVRLEQVGTPRVSREISPDTEKSQV
jgi:hypothetical protein